MKISSSVNYLVSKTNGYLMTEQAPLKKQLAARVAAIALPVLAVGDFLYHSICALKEGTLSLTKKTFREEHKQNMVEHFQASVEGLLNAWKYLGLLIPHMFNPSITFKPETELTTPITKPTTSTPTRKSAAANILQSLDTDYLVSQEKAKKFVDGFAEKGFQPELDF